MLPLKTQLTSGSYASAILASELCRSLRLHCGHSYFGTFTNQIQAASWEPRPLVVTDPRADHQPLTETAYVNLLCVIQTPLCTAWTLPPHATMRELA